MRKGTAILTGAMFVALAAITQAKTVSPGDAAAKIFFNRTGLVENVQDTAKTRVTRMDAKIVDGWISVKNYVNGQGEVVGLASLDISSEALKAASGKPESAPLAESDLVGAYKVAGIDLAICKKGAVAYRRGSNTREPVEDVVRTEWEVESATVVPYAGKNGIAIITLVGEGGEKTVLVLFVDNRAEKLFRRFDAKKDAPPQS